MATSAAEAYRTALATDERRRQEAMRMALLRAQQQMRERQMALLREQQRLARESAERRQQRLLQAQEKREQQRSEERLRSEAQRLAAQWAMHRDRMRMEKERLRTGNILGSVRALAAMEQAKRPRQQSSHELTATRDALRTSAEALLVPEDEFVSMTQRYVSMGGSPDYAKAMYDLYIRNQRISATHFDQRLRQALEKLPQMNQLIDAGKTPEWIRRTADPQGELSDLIAWDDRERRFKVRPDLPHYYLDYTRLTPQYRTPTVLDSVGGIDKLLSIQRKEDAEALKQQERALYNLQKAAQATAGKIGMEPRQQESLRSLGNMFGSIGQASAAQAEADNQRREREYVNALQWLLRMTAPQDIEDSPSPFEPATYPEELLSEELNTPSAQRGGIPYRPLPRGYLPNR